MNKAGVFQKISLEQFSKDYCGGILTETGAKPVWERIKLPARATVGSAGYDFYLPYDIEIAPKKSVVIATGIRALIDEGWMLQCFPRSGLGFKYGTRLANTVGIIDSDYYFAENDGHIMCKLVNDSMDTLVLHAGDRFMQGIFVPFGITYTDEVSETRSGGFGSTGK